MSAFSKAIDDRDSARSISSADEQASLRQDIILAVDIDPALATSPVYRRMVDSLDRIPGVAAAAAKTRSAFTAARRSTAYLETHPRGASVISTSDTAALVGSLLEVSDALGDTTADTASAITNGWTAEDNAASVYGLDSSTRATLATATTLGNTTDLVLWPLIFEYYAEGGVPEARLAGLCTGNGNGTSPYRGPTADLHACPPWCWHIVTHAVKFGVQFLARQVEDAKIVTLDLLDESITVDVSLSGVVIEGAGDELAGSLGSILFEALFTLKLGLPPTHPNTVLVQ